MLYMLPGFRSMISLSNADPHKRIPDANEFYLINTS